MEEVRKEGGGGRRREGKREREVESRSMVGSC